MGILGLTTYLRENKATLAHTLEFADGDDECLTTVVVDGWSFIYELIRCADLPWVYGGEYDVFCKLIAQVVSAWIRVGLRVVFVFDGPYPRIKFPTIIARSNQTNIHGGLLFFRTSAAARSTSRFLHETSMLPPLAYNVCIRTLLDLTSNTQYHHLLDVHFADEEGDPYAVALAGRLGAYVVGRDSDYVILNTEGYKGYIPMDEMVWHAISSIAVSETDSVNESIYSGADEEVDDDGFQKVRRPKARKRTVAEQRTGRGLLPPDVSNEPSARLMLMVAVYTPASLASRLELPVSLLSLLGALVGNDFTGTSESAALLSAQISSPRRSLRSLFFERQLTLVQRITRVAKTLHTILATTMSSHQAAPKRRNRRQIGSVMELIDAAVTALLLRPPDTTAAGEKESIVERIAEATLQYALPRHDGRDTSEDGSVAEEDREQGSWASDICAIHAHESCPLFAFLSHHQNEREIVSHAYDAANGDEPHPRYFGDEQGPHARVRALYLSAYRRGDLDPHILDVLSTGTAWSRLFLEHPDKETVSRSIGRPIREWYYSLLESGIGLPRHPDADANEEENSEDELIDVVEESDDDLLAPLRGALEQLGDQEDANGVQKVVTEYIRRGTHLAAEDVIVPPLDAVLAKLSVPIPVSVQQNTQNGSALPVQLWEENARMTFLFCALSSNVPSARRVRGAQLAAVLAVRWTVMRMHLRAEESKGNKDREMEKWTKDEARAFLAAFSWTSTKEDLAEAHDSVVPVQERNIQLLAQVSMAAECIGQLAQVLLLADLVPSPMPVFSGRRFHAALTDGTAQSANTLLDNLLAACVEGQENAFAEKILKPKKERKKAAASPTPSKVRPAGQARKQSVFEILSGLDA
ncbi:uncharacterized protein LAESUDRAFT_688293 [Laetiporus sulphureus 93-53]|uniref:PIN domain-like protein n=1 Tax=Laetiporus sulphureus 93-53 TaxID=1314785 RepID=A0A165B5Q8_9APHY|nr:uncharacterized protein LAESUDRAFT_688293 [Laetiporus sulphureus 93-53]KZT00298.1 hypothetical protein LAESUDRAFT_688293 [Laetiporus sulphureus 93-53]